MHRTTLRLAVLGAALLVAAGARAANDCTKDCTQAACSVDCTEADVRDAVRKAKHCARSPVYTGRRITFNTGGGSCTITMMQELPNSRIASCFDPERWAVCIKGRRITIDGENRVTFTYGGSARCQNCSGECPAPQPALFTLKGDSNTLENFTMEYFPEGTSARAATTPCAALPVSPSARTRSQSTARRARDRRSRAAR